MNEKARIGCHADLIGNEYVTENSKAFGNLFQTTWTGDDN